MSRPPLEASGQLAELLPLARRALRDDPSAVLRIQVAGGSASALVRLPFGVLVARTVSVQPAGSAGGHGPNAQPVDVTVSAAELVAWLDEDGPAPQARDDRWRWGVPPRTGWQRIDTVPDEVIRRLVRSGALALREAAEREGVPGAQPRAEVADALLDAVVLTVSDDAGTRTAEVTLRTISALTRMGFLARGSHAAIDVSGRWIRVAASYGSVFAERGRPGLTLL